MIKYSPEVSQFLKLVGTEDLNCFVEPLELMKKELIVLAVNNAKDPSAPGGSHWSLLIYTLQVCWTFILYLLVEILYWFLYIYTYSYFTLIGWTFLSLWFILWNEHRWRQSFIKENLHIPKVSKEWNLKIKYASFHRDDWCRSIFEMTFR